MSVEKKQLPFPYEFYELDPALNEEMKKDFRGEYISKRETRRGSKFS